MKILLHTCCGPCTIYPLEKLREKSFDVTGFFYRHNIHPYKECMKREETLLSFADEAGIKIIAQKGYELEEFLRMMAFREKERCRFCYHERLKATAIMAKSGKFDAFSSTLLYSRFQNHELIKETGESISKSLDIPFYYEDFREGWKYGIETSKQKGMYRQNYCGCIYSEKDRFYKKNEK